MNNKGFTLIELLAVIVILAIIALIAVPLILNIVADARKGAFKSSVYGIIKASEYTYAKNILNTEPLRELVFEYNDGVETSNIGGYQLEYNGEKPQSGVLIIKKTGEIDLALFDGTYCAEKAYDEIEVTVTEGDAESCITEVEKPSIELVGSTPFYIEINVNNPVIYEDPGVIALNIDESPNNDVTIEIYQEDNLVNEINTGLLGEYKITYTITDDGKTNQVERMVIIRDTTPPVLTVPASETITTTEVSDYDLMVGVTVTDNSGENISVTVSSNLSTIPGNYIITYRAEDSSDNFVEISRTITVQDIEAPVITILGDNPVTMNVGESYTDAGATALDDVDGDLTEDIVITGSVNPNIPGTYQITYTVTDSSNNTTTATRTINVIDNIPPTLSFGTNGNNIWSRNHSTTVNVTDIHSNIDNSSLRYLITTTSSGITESQMTTGFSNGGTINMTTQTGNYYIWILAKDIHGNTTIERSNAFRIDNTSPVISSVSSGVDDITHSSIVITRNGSASDAHSGLSANPYVYQTSTDNSSWTTRCTNNSTSCNVTGLNDDTTYYYRICVVDNVGNQNCLASKTATTPPQIYSDNSGASIPKLSDGMIPIRWDGSKWIKANVSQQWYNYGNKEWANSVLVDSSARSSYQNALPGTVINESDVLAYLVWVPRYRYQLFNVEFLEINQRRINIEFESKDVPKSNGSVNDDWLTHPAFTFGNDELDGFWVGKFETTGDVNTPTVKPNIESLRQQNVRNQFTTAQRFSSTNIYGLTSESDSHMMKNIEWGAVAYLSRSSYGKNSELSINNSSLYLTGGGNYISNPGQSTTGNIYGIYDMSGGASENVMGGMYEYFNTSIYVSSSGFNQSVIDSSTMDKYIDKYNYYSGSSINQMSYNRSKLGDATGETRGWYGDRAYFVTASSNMHTWFSRGGWSNLGDGAGAFSFNSTSGVASHMDSFRVVILGK